MAAVSFSNSLNDLRVVNDVIEVERGERIRR